MGNKLRFLGVLVCCVILTLSGCGGGGGGGGGGGTINSGVAVDPYIVGGIFQEIGANGVLVQETTVPSDSSGKFSFPAPLKTGNTIALKAGTGTHGGVPFTGTLKRKIDASSGPVILNPLTTLIANGISADDVLTLLKAISPGVTFTLADLTADPMANLSDGTMTAADKALLAANMAVNTAVEVLGGNLGDLIKIEAVAKVVAAELTNSVFNDLGNTSSPVDIAAATGAAVSITSYLADNSTEATISDDASNAGDLANEIIEDLSDPTTQDQPVIITNNEGTLELTQVEDLNALALTYYTDGQAAYTEGSTTGSTATLMTAIEKFNAAAALTASITDAALKDKVLFFGAFAKVLQVAKPMSDGMANGLNNFGDVLDAFGLAEGTSVENDRRNLNAFDLDTCTTDGSGVTDCIIIMSPDSPMSGELQTFMYTKIGAGLKEAVAMLNQVSPTFTETVNDVGVAVEFDATDAKFISAVANGMLAQINLLQAYNVNVDIDAENNRTTNQTPEQFLAANPNLGKLQDATRVAAVKTYANAAITALEEAVVALKAETDEQANDFVKFDNTNCYWTNNYSSYVCDPTTYNDTAELEATLAKAKTAINASSYNVMDNGPDEIAGNGDDVVAAEINVAKFFAGVDLRSKLPSTFNNGASGDMPGLLPDPTIGGVLVKIEGQDPSVLNTDEDGDGSPDIFTDDKSASPPSPIIMTNFVPGMLEGHTYSTTFVEENGEIELLFTFDSGTAFSGTYTYQISLEGQVVTDIADISGTYTTAQNVLSLNFAPPLGDMTRLVSTLQHGYSEGETGFDVETKFYNGVTLLGTTNNRFNEIGGEGTAPPQ